MKKKKNFDKFLLSCVRNSSSFKSLYNINYVKLNRNFVNKFKNNFFFCSNNFQNFKLYNNIPYTYYNTLCKYDKSQNITYSEKIFTRRYTNLSKLKSTNYQNPKENILKYSINANESRENKYGEDKDIFPNIVEDIKCKVLDKSKGCTNTKTGKKSGSKKVKEKNSKEKEEDVIAEKKSHKNSNKSKKATKEKKIKIIEKDNAETNENKIIDEKVKKKKAKKTENDVLTKANPKPKKEVVEKKKKIDINELVSPILDKNIIKEKYFKEYKEIGIKNNIIINKLDKTEDVERFVSENKSLLMFGNIFAYNNFLYEIYDKFSNSDIKKVKKIIKNYDKLTKKTDQRKIKYFESFYEICPKEYKDVLTCLFIQSSDILKEEDINNTFYYDQIISNYKDNEGNMTIESELANLENGNSNIKKRKDNHYNTKYKNNENNYNNKIVYDIDVKFSDNYGGKNINENNFIIAYNLPIINYDLLREELKETFSFCGEIKNIEFFNDRLKTIDLNLLNEQAISEHAKKSLNMKNDDKGAENSLLNCENKKEKKKKKAERNKNAQSPNSVNNNFNNYTQLYAIIEFYDKESVNLATSDFLRIFGIFCYKKLIYVDKCINKNIMIITHLPFHLHIYNILYILLNASVCKIDMNNKQRDTVYTLNDVSASDQNDNKFMGFQDIKNNLSKKLAGILKTNEEKIEKNNTNEEMRKTKCEFLLRNSDIKIENSDDIHNMCNSTNFDIYEHIYEISEKNFFKFKDQNIIDLKIPINGNDGDVAEEKEKMFETFSDFYQNKNKKLKEKTLNINNNGRTIILHFDKFSNLYNCLKTFKHIFKNKNCMIFSLNLRRCVYINGEIKDHVQVKNYRKQTDIY
ncbi:conserved Plasmodium protein, unknown function [Plasmodium berghei]|uniref:Uncharacterized protein n=2 Tax=Plasmodium berghei TaxID=5821 RepID=A0A509AHK8_PLABA|nr:conserved Plasmodium protein, unknown function [Plasmodium berghei ANKA]CXI23354.1 conserved Plasmodium protein, unknown function [Plasmodium berghei]SCM20192.1 conserved Plasmodium protein, unknown function [Plasmodium berghei]SCN23816.1 conserved Plasmodium protein, unknown function [Plasmodium berghei]SCO59254.1 conserved Plasmodium protein, unknown function [Plasmodium berghei]SCO60208.1 conserved Plasmodium protein, unknown function [Plasmodium berghei]|eukprot:XP_034420792.1 conserved Plasmodium protein, unknown function [Plasmodium berghei ANKA]